jgi:hypothetical protein
MDISPSISFLKYETGMQLSFIPAGRFQENNADPRHVDSIQHPRLDCFQQLVVA